MGLLPTEQGVGASAGLRPRAAGPPFSWERTSAPAWLSEVEQGGSNAGTQGCPERAQAPQSAFAIQCSRNHPGAEARSKPEPGPALGTGRVSLLMTRGAYEVRDLKRPTDSSDPPPPVCSSPDLSAVAGEGTRDGTWRLAGGGRAPGAPGSRPGTRLCQGRTLTPWPCRERGGFTRDCRTGKANSTPHSETGGGADLAQSG